MQEFQIEEIIECLPEGRTMFHYFKDKYALMLLSYYTKTGKTMRDIKSSRYAGLLNKPIVKEVTSRLPGGQVNAQDLQNVWPEEYETYLLTLDQWGSEKKWRGYQISRPGKNLVLQLNFSNKHNFLYNLWVDPDNDELPFVYWGHPTSDDRLTLAWVRLDIELDQGEALIEEVQNDWIREVLNWKTEMREDHSLKIDDTECAFYELHRYIKEALSFHIRVWDEAMLAAAIWFLREELGIRRIFYHTYETGIRCKQIRWGKPPRSIYTELPRKFCFVESREAPEFLQQCRNRHVRAALKQDSSKWFLLEA